MTFHKFSFALLAVAVLFSGCSKQQGEPVKIQAEERIDGSVFIVTEGAESIKLGLVTVVLFDAEQIKPPLLRNATLLVKTNIDKFLEIEGPLFSEAIRPKPGANEAYQEYKIEAAKRKQDWIRNTFQIYLDNVASPIETSKTDADGRFSFTIPRGHYLLAASAERKVLDKTEIYCWLVRVDFDGKPIKQVMLSNDNRILTENTPIQFSLGDSTVELFDPMTTHQDQIVILKQNTN
jgi:hypothetical protein